MTTNKNPLPSAEEIFSELTQAPAAILNLISSFGIKLGASDEATHADTDQPQPHHSHHADPNGAEVPTEPSKPAEGHTAPPEVSTPDAHDPGCPVAEAQGRRERAWAICDEAFPRDPHLWSAMEALFLAAESPRDRTPVLAGAMTHIEHHLETIPKKESNPFAGFAEFMDFLGN